MSARKIVSDEQIKQDYRKMSSGDMAKKYNVARGTVNVISAIMKKLLTPCGGYVKI